MISVGSYSSSDWGFELHTTSTGKFTIKTESRNYVGINYVTHHVRDSTGNVVAAKYWDFELKDPCHDSRNLIYSYTVRSDF